jgi:hypothetical protein
MIGPASKKSGVKGSLAPGGAIGVQLVSGDMDQTAVGTVTFRYGNRLLAFGHPMFGMGAVSLPMTTSYIHDIFPSYQRSFKLASPIQQMGALQQDTQYAIGGTLGAQPDMIPMTVALRDPERRIARTYRVRVMKDPVLTPLLMENVAMEAVETALGQTSDKMVRVGLRMKIDGAEDIVRKNLLYSRDSVGEAALLDFVQSLEITQQNEFARGSIARVDLDIALEPVRRTAHIKSMFADRNRAKAGDTIRISAVLEPIGEPDKTETKVFTFSIPADAPTGTMRIVAMPSSDYWFGQIRIGAPPPDPQNLPELVAAWNRVGPTNVLTVQASTPDPYLLIDRKKVPSPPPSLRKLIGLRKVIGNINSSSAAAYNETQVREAATSYSLTGAQFLSIPVESARDADRSATATVEEKLESKDVTAEVKPIVPTVEINGGYTITDDEGAFNNGAQFLQQLRGWHATGVSAREASTRNSTVPDRMQTAPTRAPSDRPITPSTTSPAPTPSPTPTPAPGPTPTPTPAVLPVDDGKGVARPALRWVQGSAAEFLRGRFERAGVVSDGTVRAAPASRQLATTPEPAGWSIAGDSRGNVYLGTGNSARILKIDASGTVSTFYTGKGVAVTALTTDAAGNVYAGFTPGGDVLRLSPSGQSSRIMAGKAAAIWALEWASAGSLLAASGGEANNSSAIYRIANAAQAADGNGNLVVRLPQKHIRALAVRGDDIFAATAEDGVLYRIDLAGKATALYQITEAASQAGEITSVAAAPDGIYFGTFNSGTVYRWDERTGTTALYASPQTSIFALRRGSDGTIYAATGDKGIVYAITPAANASDVRGVRVLEPKQLQATALNLAPNGDLLIGTANNAAAYRVTAGGEAGLYTSAIFDASNAVTWGALRADGGTWETRSGNTAEPDASWSDWQSATSNDLGELRIASPAARYLQMRARIAPNESIRRVEAVYRARNEAPTVTWTLPQGGEFWRAKKSLTWSGTDPNTDALRYRVWLSNDNATWKPVALKDADASTVEIDTTLWPDGTYRAKVEASDSARNPDDPQQDEAVSAPFVIDNTQPQKLNVSSIRQPNGDLQLEATVLDALSPLTGAEWRFIPIADQKPPAKDAKATTSAKPDAAIKPATAETAKAADKDEDDKDSDWNAMTARDGIFDSRRETVLALASATAVEAARIARGGTAIIEIRVRDAAGNTVTLQLTAS